MVAYWRRTRDINKSKRAFDRRPKSNPRLAYRYGDINSRSHKERHGYCNSTGCGGAARSAGWDTAGPNRYKRGRNSRYYYG